MAIMSKTKKTSKTSKKSTKQTTSKKLDKVETKTDVPVKVETKMIPVEWMGVVSEALAAFDFDECAEYYASMDWKWGGYSKSGLNPHVPDKSEIIKQACELMNDAVVGVVGCKEETASYVAATGGLVARAFKYPNPNDNWIWLGFVPVETIY